MTIDELIGDLNSISYWYGGDTEVWIGDGIRSEPNPLYDEREKVVYL